MIPLKLPLDKSIPVTPALNTSGDCKKADVFYDYVSSWEKLITKSCTLEDFLRLHSISGFSGEDIYHLEKILDKAFIRHGESEFIEDSIYFESFTIVIPTKKEPVESKYKKSYSQSYLLGTTRSKSYYVSFGLYCDRSKPDSQQYILSNFYLTKGTVKSSLETFFKRGFWLGSFNESFTAIFRSILSSFRGESLLTVNARKKVFIKNVFNILFKESLSSLAFSMIEKDYENYFKLLHEDSQDQYDPNLLNMVVKQRFDVFKNNPRLVLEDEALKPVVDTPYTAARFDASSKNPQNDFFKAVLGKIISKPYPYEDILNYDDKEKLLSEIIRSQFALNYLGKISFSASYLIRNRNNPKKETLTLLRNSKNSCPLAKTSEIFNIVYPNLVSYLKSNFDYSSSE